MNNLILMIRFGELSTKGKNKKDFINILSRNIKNSLKKFSSLTFETRWDHIYVFLNDENLNEVLEILQGVSGISGISLVYRIEKDIEVIKDECLSLIKKENAKTFKVKSKRSDKSFPMNSDEIVRAVASKILKNSDYKVDVHHPDVLLNIEIRDESAYIFTKTVKGAGGYPLGVGKKAMMMLSGGIDSPVAAYLMMKRGVMVECIHFASPPYTQVGVIYKLMDLLKVLNTYQPVIRLHIVPFTKLQEEIYKHSNESYAITIMRRMMYRIAERVARYHRCLAICNGESIGQVASQTLASMRTINAVTNYPIIRPLATYDKLEIIDIANKIKTFDISIRPYEDCCTIFEPKNPKTAPHIEDVEKYEARFDFESLIKEAIDNIETVIIKDEEELL